jgi:Cullin protein neddylation domain
MKSRKKVTYNNLRLEVVTLMQNFKPDEALIKKRIDSLIEREYIMKDKIDENTLLYKP